MIQTISYNQNIKARKEHKCNYCSGAIYKGEKYERSVLTYEGELYEWKTHKMCAWLAVELDMYSTCSDGEGVTQEDFVEIVNNKFDTFDYSGKTTFKERVELVYSDISSLKIPFFNELHFIDVIFNTEVTEIIWPEFSKIQPYIKINAKGTNLIRGALEASVLLIATRETIGEHLKSGMYYKEKLNE